MPKCTINGQQVEVKPGATIIEAFKQAGVDIAHYCYHPALSVAGCCRLCMVEIEGNPKLQIACNTAVNEGMVISNQSEKVKDTVRWGMDFHLINHPLDCPICDQAGECGLQEQYMKYGKYDPEMAERKVKKSKVVDLGSKIVLDSERCILCSRCVRFTAEVSKTFEFGIFQRGDRSEIGTVEGKPVENNYALNTVDICPVGALTAKDFRFRQRVWYLKNAESICPGCSTGCKIKVYYNEEGLFRVKPAHDPEVNGYWMCDEGRNAYQFVNPKARLKSGLYGRAGVWEELDSHRAAFEAGEKIRQVSKSGAGVAVVVTGQYSNEEYQSVFDFFKNVVGTQDIFHWKNNPEKWNEFDGILFRGDRNPNTAGLLNAFSQNKIKTEWSDLEALVQARKAALIVVLGPENPAVYTDLQQVTELVSKCETLVWMGAGRNPHLEKTNAMTWQIPVKAFFEKSGSFTNYKGLIRKFKKGTLVMPQALTLSEISQLMAGQKLASEAERILEDQVKTNFFTGIRGDL